MKKRIGRILLVLLLIFAAETLWSNLTVGVTHYTVLSERLPSSFNGFKIVQLSDVHNAVFGQDNAQIVNILRNEQPDIIVFTGDLVDSNRLDLEAAIILVKQAVEIAPCYYVTGNHEAALQEQLDKILEQLETCSVKVLRDQWVYLKRGGETIQLIGIDDPSFYNRRASIIKAKIKNMKLPEGFKVVLSHHPESFGSFVDNDVDLALCGHTHGGQVRLPFIGGLYAPSQGSFPFYDAGRFEMNRTTMIISRGIGNSSFPIRVFNQPEVVVVTLRTENENVDGKS